MADNNQKQTFDNFDKEFSVNQKTKKAPRGKLPSWIMILAGAAMITGVVVAKQPAVRQTDNGPKTSVNIQPTATAAAETAGFSEINDLKAGPDELEAFFGVQNGSASSEVRAANQQSYNMDFQPLSVDSNGYIIPSQKADSEAAVYWIDDKPYAVTLAPVVSDDGTAESGSVYHVGDRDYIVRLAPLSDKEAAELSKEENSGVIRVGGQAYRLILEPAAPEETAETAGITADAPVQESETAANIPAETVTAETADDNDSEIGSEEKPAVAWMNEKPYSVTLNPWQPGSDNESNAEDTEKPSAGNHSSDASVPVLSVTVLDEDKSSPAPVKSVVFEIDGKKYEAEIKEIDEAGLTPEQTADPIVWADTTPLVISLAPVNNVESPQETGEDTFDVILNAVPEEKLPELLTERFGEAAADYLPQPENTPEPVITPEPEQEPEPQQEGSNTNDENWFVGMFHNIFGGSPTETPVPQVTVVAVTPTAVPVRPTQTPIVVRVEPTAAVQGPVRLDGISSKPEQESGKSLEDDLNDPALWDDSEDGTNAAGNTEPGVQRQEMTATAEPGQNDSTGSGQDTAPAAVSTTAVRLEATIVPEDEELPHTGMAESWNIPSMLALLAGLLLLIIGIRRLRTRE